MMIIIIIINFCVKNKIELINENKRKHNFPKLKFEKEHADQRRGG